MSRYCCRACIAKHVIWVRPANVRSGQPGCCQCLSILIFSNRIIHTRNNQFNLAYPAANASFLISHGRYSFLSSCPSGYAHIKCSLVLDCAFSSISSSLWGLRHPVSNYIVYQPEWGTHSPRPTSSANSFSSRLMRTRVLLVVSTFVVDSSEPLL